ncbi:hypothetical protein GCM10009530_39040 [Microbispora corallina]|uniref:Uncharacterized protein n=1 Tax=Microbispora corallina TaxID=83302 RepID=A0ABQ4G2Q4_9ACTN|nr:hypothetical protein Mco01_43520 [Microbispora corallina]
MDVQHGEEGARRGRLADAAPDDVFDADRRIGDLDGDHAAELGHVGGGEHGDAEALPDEPGQEVRVGHFERDVAGEPGGGERLVGLDTSGRLGRQVHEHLRGEPAKVDRRLLGERVVRRDHGDEPVTGQLADVHAFGPHRGRHPEEGHFDGPLLHLLDELLARAHAQADAHGRVPLVELTKGAGDVDRRDGGDQAHGEPSAHLADGRGHLGHRALGGVQALAGGGEERGTGRAEAHPAAGPLEEFRAQFPFQPRYLVAERGLDDQAPFGCPGEAVRLGDGDEVSHLLQLHGSSLYHDRWPDKHVLDSLMAAGRDCQRDEFGGTKDFHKKPSAVFSMEIRLRAMPNCSREMPEKSPGRGTRPSASQVAIERKYRS